MHFCRHLTILQQNIFFSLWNALHDYPTPKETPQNKNNNNKKQKQTISLLAKSQYCCGSEWPSPNSTQQTKHGVWFIIHLVVYYRIVLSEEFCFVTTYREKWIITQSTRLKEKSVSDCLFKPRKGLLTSNSSKAFNELCSFLRLVCDDLQGSACKKCPSSSTRERVLHKTQSLQYVMIIIPLPTYTCITRPSTSWLSTKLVRNANSMEVIIIQSCNILSK